MASSAARQIEDELESTWKAGLRIPGDHSLMIPPIAEVVDRHLAAERAEAAAKIDVAEKAATTLSLKLGTERASHEAAMKEARGMVERLIDAVTLHLNVEVNRDEARMDMAWSNLTEVHAAAEAWLARKEGT